jgi:hypothetical protein
VTRGGDLKQLFPTVMLQRQLDHLVPLNSALREIVLQNESKSAGVTSSNVGGVALARRLPGLGFS